MEENLSFQRVSVGKTFAHISGDYVLYVDCLGLVVYLPMPTSHIVSPYMYTRPYTRIIRSNGRVNKFDKGIPHIFPCSAYGGMHWGNSPSIKMVV